jgi:hypothetical protein
VLLPLNQKLRALRSLPKGKRPYRTVRLFSRRFPSTFYHTILCSAPYFYLIVSVTTVRFCAFDAALRPQIKAFFKLISLHNTSTSLCICYAKLINSTLNVAKPLKKHAYIMMNNMLCLSTIPSSSLSHLLSLFPFKVKRTRLPIIGA